METIRYRTLRRFSTTCHLMEVPKSAEIAVTLCRGDAGRRQPLQEIRHNWYEKQGWQRIGGVNGGFFDGSRVLPYGLFYVDSGFLLSESWAGDTFLELIHQDGQLHIDDVTAAQFKARYPKANWGVSLSYGLVISGKKDIRKGEQFPFTNQSHPRTLIGDSREKYLLVVTEGRMTNEKGLTADESAELMLELGATTAINADGGGSSAMDLQGRVQNAYYANRAVADGILVYARPGVAVIKGNESVPTEPAAEAQGQVVAVDIGHGIDTYPPNKGVPSMPEFEFNNAVGKLLQPLLENHGFRVVMTQPPDGKETPLRNRTEAANTSGAAVFVSLHADASSNATARGHWAFYWHNSANGKRLAEIWQRHAARELPNPSRGIVACEPDTWTNFFVVRETRMPAMLVEHGFMTNETDLALLKSEGFRLKCAQVMTMSLCEYLGVSYQTVEQSEEPADVRIPRYEVMASALNVRSDKMGSIIGQVYRGERVDKIGEHPDGDWYIVRKDTLIGFVSAAYLA